MFFAHVIRTAGVLGKGEGAISARSSAVAIVIAAVCPAAVGGGSHHEIVNHLFSALTRPKSLTTSEFG